MLARTRSTSTLALVSGALCLFASGLAHAQNGVSDDRVSLPDGPGSIGGVGENVGVDANMGTASFSVPIRVPAGATAAMTPQVALVYSSGQGMGVVGMGWGLPSPTIERTISKGLPTYTVSDRFAADGGDELVYTGTDGAGRTYRSRFEGGFVRYRWHAPGAGLGGYWTAEYPDGRVGYFGADAEGDTVDEARVEGRTAGSTFRYALVEVRDPSGRRMAYRYMKDLGTPLLTGIDYAFGNETTPRFGVRFDYEARDDVRSDATPGVEILLRMRLATIRVLSDTTTIRRYELGYESSDASGGMSRLAGVTEFGIDGDAHPIAHSFAYTRTLDGACTVGCESPFVVDMGTLPGGVDIQTGRAALIDINGDALPDVLDCDANGHHHFHIAQLSSEGRPTFTATVVDSAATTSGSSFILSNPGVQLLDVNGDGFTDIVDQVNGKVLCNDGSGDWHGTGCLEHPGDLPPLSDDPNDLPSDANPLGARFFDYDNDKRIDLLRTPTADSAFVSRNTGTGYTSLAVSSIGAAFDADRLELADMNGDGLQDPVELVIEGASASLRYKLNLGRGRWSEAWASVALDGLAAADADAAELEDIDGDGLSDVVLVAGTTVGYWRNQNAGRFAARKNIGGAAVDGQIPERTGSETVLFADMNGNGTDDVVWISSSGHVRFLELFPVRPNLLARIDNGIGWVRTMTYGTSVAQRARDVGTADAWQHPLPQSMNVLTGTDDFVTLTGKEDGSGVHARAELAYRDGFYDGEEKSFRGFERVEKRLVGDDDDGQEPGLDVMTFDVGREDAYRHGLMLGEAMLGGAGFDVPLRDEHYEYSDCPVADVPADTTPSIRYVCRTATVTVHEEGADPSEWRTVRSEQIHDGYGNVTVQRELGVVSIGGPGATRGCGACPEGALSAGPCGPQCIGDERVTTSTYVTPGAATGGAWLVGLPVEVVVGASEDGRKSSRTTYYDGPDFVGLAAGQATRGLVTRVRQQVTSDTAVDALRQKWDALGNVAVVLDADADVADPTSHRREYTYDGRGLRVTRVTVRAGDHDLVQDLSYESSNLFVSEATAYRVFAGATELTGRNATSYGYDEFGRVDAIVRPGDSRDTPTMTFTYELGDPVSRIIARGRKASDGPLETESVVCQDGRGRTVQSMNKVSNGHFRVDGFRVLNSRGEVLKTYLPYESNNDQCATAAPNNSKYRAFVRDAFGRVVSETAPDASIYGTASVTRTEYEPLRITTYDNDDSDASSSAVDTPTTRVFDGLVRVVETERLLTPSAEPETYTYAWDELGNLAVVTDPMGHDHTQTYDLRGRVLSADDPNSGETTYTYDAAGNELTRTDARGVTRVVEYDALNRPVARYDAAHPAETRETTVYDRDPDCAYCQNGAGRVVTVSYPLLDGATGDDGYAYDPRGNRIRMRRTLEGHAFDTRFTYDGDDKLASMISAEGSTIKFTRDAGSRVTAIPGFVDAVTYTPEGRRASIVHSNGVTETTTYDALLRESHLGATGPEGAFIDVVLGLDRESNVLSVTDTVTRAGHPSAAATYTYDAHYRLTGATLEPGTAGVETLAFAYDALDNVRSKTSTVAGSPENVGAYTYGESAGPNAATKVGSTSYLYDLAGQVTRRGDTELVWDHEGHLAEVAPAGKEVAELAYGPGDELVMETRDGGVTYYAGAGFVVRDGIGSLYVSVDERRVARVQTDDYAPDLLPDGNSDGFIDIADAWLGRAAEGPTPQRLLRSAARHLLFKDRSDPVHLHEDVRGSIIAATDAEGAVIAERSFYPFGAERASTGFVDQHGFSGVEEEAAPGLLHFTKRTLDTTSGRWMSVDPAFAVLDAMGAERRAEAMGGYAYVANNPIGAIDPDGDILFTLFVKPLGRKVRPFHDKGDGTPDRAKTPAFGTKHLVKHYERRRAELDQLSERIKQLPPQRDGESPALAAERKALTKEASKVSKKVGRLQAKIYPYESGASFLLPDVLLIATSVAAVAIGLTFGMPNDGDDADTGGGDSSGGDGPSSMDSLFGSPPR